MSKHLCADCVSKEQCDGEWTTNCASYKKAPMTNEEWLHTLNTEQLAEWLTFKRKLIRIPETNYEAWLRWLKEKHHE